MVPSGHSHNRLLLEEILKPFIEARRNARLAFLAGAGVSKNPPANRPLAGEMLWAMSSAFWDLSIVAKKQWQKTTVCNRSKKVRFESLVQIVADTTGSVGFLRVLKGGRPNALHRMLARACIDGCPVLTTNFDLLIERAITRRSNYPRLKDTADFKNWRRRSPKGALAKLHGSLEDLNSLCATIRQIGLLGPAFMWDPQRGEYLSKVRQKYPMMIIGYSGFDDSDILPKLRITESNQPLLWVLHSNGPPRLATPEDIKRLAKAPGLAQFLNQSNAVVIAGTTLEACALFDQSIKRITTVSHDNFKEPLPSKIIFHMRRTTAPYIADFLLARIFFEAGDKSASRRLFRLLRRELNGTHPGLAARCLANEATVATDLGDWMTAGKLLDDALPGLKRWADEKSFINACINRALVYRHTGQPDQGQDLLRSLIKLLKNTSEFLLENGRCLVNLADFMFEKENFDEAVRLLKRARIEFKNVGDHSGLGMVFGVYGKLLFAQDKIEDAIALLHMALWHYEVAWDEAGKAKIYNNLGTMQRRAGLINEAIASFKKSRQIGKRIGDIEAVIVSEMGMTTVDLALGKLDSAIRRASKCLPEASRLGLSHLVVQTKGNLGLALLDSGKAKRALKTFNEILPFLTTNGPAVHIALTLRNIGECQIQLGQNVEAEENLRKAERFYRDLSRKQDAKDVRKLRGSIVHTNA